jgi:hypothetical protein
MKRLVFPIVLAAVLASGIAGLVIGPARIVEAQTTAPTKIQAPWRTTIPADGATRVLFNTHDKTVGGVLFRGMEAIVGGTIPVDTRTIYAVHITFLAHNKASAANGIRVYARMTNGTWTETDLNDGLNPPNATIGTAATYQIPALAAGRTTHLTLVVSHLINGFAVEYTAGADNPESWDGLIVIERAGTVLQ